MPPIGLVILLMLSVVLIGCGSGASNAPATTATIAPSLLGPAPTPIPISPYTPLPRDGTPALPAGVGGKIVFAPGDGSIWIQDPLTALPKPLVKGSPEAFSEAPAFSPDGRLVVFRQMILNPNAAASVLIQTIDATGKNLRTVASAPDPKSDVLWPTWSPDGQWIYYTVEPADHTHSEIRRAGASGGTSAHVTDGGRQAVLSTDGKQIAFVRFNIQNFSGSLWVANADGGNGRQLLRDDTFLTIAGPHFSPDGKSILFAASGPPKHELHAWATPGSNCKPGLLCMLAQSAYADGLPWDLWMISSDGSRSRQLTHIGGDSPWPAWSRDGKYVAFFQTDGTYLLDVSSGVVMQISRNGGHGIMDWWEP